ncbi:DUF5711 family protein [Sporofaciens musculi]|uniref:DUF5711 family protein n=1 Tax=Sporofaciens musculi TaxID=2681861 RepID=UPI002585EA54|nr:DUF5711 family protein [Sporofaciens musculi]
MKRQRDRNLHVVREQEDPTDRIVREILDELNNEDDFQSELEDSGRRHRRFLRRRWIVGIIVLLAAAAGVYLLVNLQTYSQVRVTDEYNNGGTVNNSYREFADGILKYSRDGISYLDQKGEEQWNHSYQIKNPYIEAGNSSAVVADKGGNDILVIQEDGVKGEIHTAMPIEKVSVSEQGIVGAILKNDTSAEIMCYDIAGNLLVEHKTSSVGTGYPLDIALSEDGKVMQVLYFYTQDGAMTSKVMYYNFGETGKEKTDNQVSSHEYKDTVMASGFFLDEDTSAAVGDNCLAIYQGKEVPEEKVQIALDKEIKSVIHNEHYIGLILKNEGKEGYELRLYNGDGKVVISKDFTGDYSNVKLCKRQVIMYDGKKCSIFMRNGIQKFDGEMEYNIMEIFPVAGVNKYIVMSADGMKKVRLVK